MPNLQQRRSYGDSQAASRRGAIAVLVAILLPVFLLMAGFAINVAQMQLVRAQLRVAADAAARAGARTLSLTQSKSQAVSAAQGAASQNLVSGNPLTLDSANVEFGINSRANNSSPWTFTPETGNAVVNAVRVTGLKTTSSSSGAVPLLFANITGTEHYDHVRSSVAMQIDRDIVLVVDRSGSMASAVAAGVGGGPPITRWDALCSAVDGFLNVLEDTIPEEHVALVWFDNQVGRSVNLTLNYQQIRTAINQLGPRGSTAIGLGIQEGTNAMVATGFARPYAQKTLVVMTDGVWNSGIHPTTAATAVVSQHNPVIHTVTFSTGANQSLMQQVSQIGNGRHWHSDTVGGLQDAYAEIASDIPTVLTD